MIALGAHLRLLISPAFSGQTCAAGTVFIVAFGISNEQGTAAEREPECVALNPSDRRTNVLLHLCPVYAERRTS
jgi:hypothetical protein